MKKFYVLFAALAVSVSLPAQARLVVVDYCNQSFYSTEPETKNLALPG